MRIFAGLMALALSGWLSGTPGMAQDRALERPLIVVELFMSQGCSSCPPADELLSRLAGRDDVLALALHVDYWDYIGWPDTFARAEHTERQKAYAHAAGMRSIYTPQMIIAGKDHVIGSKPMEVADYLEMYRDRPAAVFLAARRQGDRIRIEAMRATHMPVPEDLMVMLVTVDRKATVEIKRGENAGKTITYRNIVTDLEQIATWDGQGEMEVVLDARTAPGSAGDGQAVFLQVQGPGGGLGEILGATWVR